MHSSFGSSGSPRSASPADIVLRPTSETDLETLCEFARDPEAIRMAAFTSPQPPEPAAYISRWTRLLSNPQIVARTILVDDRIAGSVASFLRDADREVTYWLGREYWGRGIATAALTAFVREFRVRPLWGRAAADNAASIRVLEKCGFVIERTERSFAEARAAEIAEAVLILR